MPTYNGTWPLIKFFNRRVFAFSTPGNSWHVWVCLGSFRCSIYTHVSLGWRRARSDRRTCLKEYGHPGPLRSELKVSKACLAPKAPRKAKVTRLLESADLRLSIGHEAKLFDEDRKAKVSKAVGLATDLIHTSVRSASSVLPKARWTLSPRMTVCIQARKPFSEKGLHFTVTLLGWPQHVC